MGIGRAGPIIKQEEQRSQPYPTHSILVGGFNGEIQLDLVMASSPGDSAVVVLNTSN